jgi:hypothetical protein
MSPPEPQTPDSLLTKLSNRLIIVVAVLFILVGAGITVAVYEEWIRDPTVAHLSAAIAEAILVTGATTLIVTFALADVARMQPVLKRLFDAQASRFPSADDISSNVTASLTQEIAAVTSPIDLDVKRIRDELQCLGSAFVLRQEHIYPQSVTMLQELNKGDIRVLTTAEEDLSTEPGAEWIDALNTWLSGHFDSRKLFRVIARRPDFPDDVEKVKEQALDPFRNTNANQWIYTDPELALSVLLLGTRRAIFGFLPRIQRAESSQSRFQYAVVITNEMLVLNLVSWFDARYISDEEKAKTTKVMSAGEINNAHLAELWGDPDPSPA